MKISLNLNITFRWVRIPVIPFISFAETEIDHDGADCCESCRNLSAGTAPAPEVEILPIPRRDPRAGVPQDFSSDARHRKETTYDPDLRYRRGTGKLIGTEVYRSIHVRRDLIQWFKERSNSPLSIKQLQTMKKSPFNHEWEKCHAECIHRIVSRPNLYRVLNNSRTEKEVREGVDQVVTFEKRKKGYRLTKGFYKSIQDVEVLEYERKTPVMVANWVKENSEMRR